MGAKPAPLVALPALVLAVSIGWSLTPRTAIEQLSVRPIDETGALLAVGTTLFSGSLAAMVASSTYLVDAIGSTGLLLCTAWFRRARRWGAAPSVAVFVVSAGLGGLLPGVRWWGFYLGVESPATIVFPLASLVIGMIAWSWLPDRIR